MKEENRNKEGGLNMCKALEQLEARGRRNMLIEMILELLSDLGTIPENIREKISCEKNMEILSKWHKSAARSENLEAFIERM